MKSELAIKFDEWFESDEGKRCLDVSTLTLSDPRFLRNRIECALMAGAKAEDKVRQEVCDKLAELVPVTREKAG